MAKHALLSASSMHRILACPPSARLCANIEDRASPYAQQGTDAHELCEYKVLSALGKAGHDPTEELEFYDAEMESCTEEYRNYVMEQLEEAKKSAIEWEKAADGLARMIEEMKSQTKE